MLATGIVGTGPPAEAPRPSLPDLADRLAEVAALHRHLCPRQVLGLRMGLHAGELLGVELPRHDKRLLVFVETDGCFADAVSVATGCWLGHRTLRLVDQGKVATTVADTASGRAVRVWPHPSARRRAAELLPQAPDRWHAQLEGYQTLPAGELLVARPVTLEVDLAAIRSRPGRRVICATCGEEIVNEREVIARGRPYCPHCAGHRYYRIDEGLTLGPS